MSRKWFILPPKAGAFVLMQVIEPLNVTKFPGKCPHFLIDTDGRSSNQLTHHVQASLSIPSKNDLAEEHTRANIEEELSDLTEHKTDKTETNHIPQPSVPDSPKPEDIMMPCLMEPEPSPFPGVFPTTREPIRYLSSSMPYLPDMLLTTNPADDRCELAMRIEFQERVEGAQKAEVLIFGI